MNISNSFGIPQDPISASIASPFKQNVINNDRGPDFPDGFTITEYIAGIPQKSVIKLLGNLMPFTPFEWTGEQRLVKEYYPGNPEPAVHVMGDKEGPLTLKGRFKDKRYDPTKVSYGTAYQYALLFETLRKRGNLLKFGMHGSAGSWFRYGFLESSEFKMNKLSWIDYSLAFLVVSHTQPKNNYFAAPEKTAPSAINTQIISAAEAFQTTYSNIPTTMPQSIAGRMNTLISSVATAINLVTNFVQNILTTAEDIEASAHRALGLIKNARTTIFNFRDQIDSIQHSFSNFSSEGSPAAQASSTYINLSSVLETSMATVGLSQLLAQMQAQFEAISKTLPKARYKIVAGDTLQNISVKFYGVADNWKVIYDHNKLLTTVLTPGAVLEIPKT